MLRVHFDPSNLPRDQKIFFDNWLQLSQVAQKSINNCTRSDRSKLFQKKSTSEVWRKLKVWLLNNYFHGKCAYCECKIDAGFVGHAEHYRPKAGVQEKVGTKWKRVPDHDGYYWIALHWANLLPCCEKCNAGTGKGTRFPVSKKRAFGPADGLDPEALDRREEPSLLHPYLHDPEKHLIFLPDGSVEAKDELGKSSIEILGLNREPLRDSRKRHLELVICCFASHVSEALRKDKRLIKAELNEIQSQLAAPSELYSEAVRQTLATIRGAMAP